MTDAEAQAFLRASRRWSVHYEDGDVFDRDDDYSGYTLTVEIADEAEAEAVSDLLRARLPHWRPGDDSL